MVSGIALFSKIANTSFFDDQKVRFTMRNLALCLLGLLLLMACSAGFMPAAQEQTIPPLDGGFHVHLAQEYRNLAAFEAEQMENPADALLFTEKAARAQRGRPVVPENPEQRDLPDFAYPELASSYNMLLDALTQIEVPGNEPLLAMAQTRYDCWLTHQHNYPQRPYEFACKTAFLAAMSQLQMPERENNTYSIYFKSGAVVPDDEAMDTVRAAAEYFKHHRNWDIELASYTDGTGSREENRTLSMRRAIAVRNALAQQGVDQDHISIRAEGAALAVQTGRAGEDDASLRRVDIEFRPDDGDAPRRRAAGQAAGWEHAGDG